MRYKFNIPTTEEILADLVAETKVSSKGVLTKFTKNSVIRGILYAVASVLTYTKGYILSISSKNFLSSCSATDLDEYAKEFYGATRKGKSKSSTEIFVQGKSRTAYLKGTKFQSTTGVVFTSVESKIIPEGKNFTFIPVESEEAGSTSKCLAYTINKCLKAPEGHEKCTNFIPTYGGYDEESDDEFKSRLQILPERMSQETPAKIEALTYELFEEVGKCFCTATSQGFCNLSVLKVSGAELSEEEKGRIYSALQARLGFTNSINLKVINISKVYLDFALTVTIKASSEFQEVFNEIQAVLLAFFEPRFYSSSSVRGDLLLAEISRISDIIDIEQSSYSFKEDIKTPRTVLPWLRSINLKIKKESGEVKQITQDISSIEHSSFNPNYTDGYIEVI